MEVAFFFALKSIKNEWTQKKINENGENWRESIENYSGI